MCHRINDESWLFFVARQRELNVTLLEANVQHLKPSTRYMIHVYGFNSYGISETPARLTVQTKTEGHNPSHVICFIVNDGDILSMPSSLWRVDPSKLDGCSIRNFFCMIL